MGNFSGRRAGWHSWLVQVSLAAQLLARQQESRCICQLALQHDHLHFDPACSTRHTVAGRRQKNLVLGSQVRKYFQLSGKLPFVHIEGAQPWSHRFPQPGAELSRHALADGRPGCRFELGCWYGCARPKLWYFGQRFVSFWSIVSSFRLADCALRCGTGHQHYVHTSDRAADVEDLTHPPA